ncbi:MAG: C25 family cysteine peptidase [Thermoplasmatota archaeon]
MFDHRSLRRSMIIPLILLLVLPSLRSPIGGDGLSTSGGKVDGSLSQDLFTRTVTIPFNGGIPRIVQGPYGAEVRMDDLEMDPRSSHLRLPIWTDEIELPLGSDIVQASLKDAKYLRIPVPADIGMNPHSIAKGSGAEPVIPAGGFEAPEEHLAYTLSTGIDHNDLGTNAYLSLMVSPVTLDGNALECILSGKIEIEYTYPAERKWYATEEFDVLVICPEIFTEIAAEYAEFRNATGKDTKVVTMEDILSDRYWNIQENDTQEEIKRFIYQARLNWGIDFVLLAGDEEHIPARHILVLDGYDDSGAQRSDGAFVPSDLYYSDLFEDGTTTFTNWNADLSGDSRYLWGEYNGGIRDDPDLYPDVFVGRLPASTVEEFTDMFDKIRGYELNAKGSEWFYNATLCGTDTFPQYPTAEGEYECDFIDSSYLDEFNVTKLYESTGTLFNISTVIDQGTGLLVFSDHGDYDGWGYTSGYPSGAYKSMYANNQDNGYMLPIAILDACLTHGFDNENASNVVSGQDPVYNQWYYPPGSSRATVDCLGEYLHKNPDGGAIATYGCTRVGYGSSGMSYPMVNSGYFNARLNKAISDGVKTPGQVLASAVRDYLVNIGRSGSASYKTITEYILLGDPSLSIGGISGTKLEVETDPVNVTVRPGEEVEVDFTIRNTGIIPTDVLLNVTVQGNGRHVWTANVSVYEGSLPVDGELNGTLSIYAPPDALFNEVRDIVLRVDSILLSKAVTYTVEAFTMRMVGLDVSVDPYDLSTPQGSYAVGYVKVENLGNGPETVDLTFPDLPAEWTIETGSSTAEVEPYKDLSIPFKLTLPARFLAGTYSHKVSVLSSQTGASAEGSFNMTVEPDMSYDLEIPVEIVELYPEEYATIPFDIIGNGNVGMGVTVKWMGSRMDDWDVRVLNGSMELSPFSNGTGGIRVRPPNGTDPGVYTMYVTADNGIEEKEDVIDIVVKKLYAFELRVEETVREADPGERVSFYLNVSNLGNIFDQFNMTMVETPEGNWSVALNPKFFSVAKESHRRVYLDITSEFPLNGTYGFRVKVSPWSGGGPQFADLKVVIRRTYDFEVSGDAPDNVRKPGESLVFQLELRNLGNTFDTITMNASTEDGWPVTISNSTMTLGPTAASGFIVSVLIPADAMAGEYRLLLHVVSNGSGLFRDFERTLFVDEVYSLEVAMDLVDSTVLVRPGRFVQFDVSIRNRGNTHDKVDIGYSSSSYVEGWVTLSTSSFSRIPAGDNKTFQVMLDVPGNVTEGEYRLTLWIGSMGEMEAMKLNVTIRVEKKGGSELFSKVDPVPLAVAGITGLGIILVTLFILVKLYRKSSGVDIEEAGMEWESDDEEDDDEEAWE